MSLDPSFIITKLGLKPLPLEGGYYKETVRSELELKPGAVESLHDKRALFTAIYYLLTPDSFSAFHRLKWDEVFHFYQGDPVELHLLQDERSQEFVLGHDLVNDEQPQLMVPADTWMGARLQPGGQFALLGTTMAPGFDFDDFELGDRSALIHEYPESETIILRLTR